jgi:hypothetical protein
MQSILIKLGTSIITIFGVVNTAIKIVRKNFGTPLDVEV